MRKVKVPEQSKILHIDLGCGPNKREGFIGVDALPFNGKVDVVMDIRKKWPWKTGTVEEAHSSHFVEHLTSMERIHFWNELFRVLKAPIVRKDGTIENEGGKALIIVPHWASSRAYGDPTHQWPPIGEFTWYYLKRDWREANAPHCDRKNVPWGLDCNFEAVGGYSFHPSMNSYNTERQQFAIQNYKEAAQDSIVTLTRLV